MADIIKVEHLSYIYNPGMPNAVTALDDVSFTVEEGEFVGIIGAHRLRQEPPSLPHMNGLNKPTSGKIYIDGARPVGRARKNTRFPFPHRSGVPVPGVPAV